MQAKLDPQALYDYLHAIIDEATHHNDECDDDLLDCTCDADTNGANLVDGLFAALEHLREAGAKPR